MDVLKEAVKARDTTALRLLGAIRSAILLAKIKAGAAAELTEEEESKLLQKLVRQRRDNAALYAQQGRSDLAEPELARVAMVEKFLPKQLSEAEVAEAVKTIIVEAGGTSARDTSKVIGVTTK